MSEKNDIGGFFKEKLDNQQISLKGSEWMNMEKKLRRKRFFHFSLGNLNVYYLVFIAGLISTGIVLNPFNKKENTKYENTNPETINVKEVNTKSKNITVEKVEPQDKHIETTTNNTPEKISNTSNNIEQEGKTEVILEFSIEKDTAGMEVIEETTEPKIKTVEKTIYVVEQDTIIKYDTVIQKTRKKWPIFDKD